MILALAVAVPACSSSAPGSDAPGSSEAAATAFSPAERAAFRAEGARLAETFCAGCHALSAETASPNLDAPAFPKLHERYPDALLADAFPQRLDVGHPAMPAFAFERAELDALLEYLQSIQTERGA